MVPLCEERKRKGIVSFHDIFNATFSQSMVAYCTPAVRQGGFIAVAILIIDI